MLNTGTNGHIVFKKGPLKVIAFITLWFFLFSIFSYDLAWAAEKPLELTGVCSERPGSPGSSLAIDSMLDDEELEIEADSHNKLALALAVKLVTAKEKGVPFVVIFRDTIGRLLKRKIIPRESYSAHDLKENKPLPKDALVVKVVLSEDRKIIACGEIGKTFAYLPRTSDQGVKAAFPTTDPLPEGELADLNREEYTLLLEAVPTELHSLLETKELEEMDTAISGWLKASENDDGRYAMRHAPREAFNASPDIDDVRTFYQERILDYSKHPNQELLLQGLTFLFTHAPVTFALVNYAVDSVHYAQEAKLSGTVIGGMVDYNEELRQIFEARGPAWFAYFLAHEAMHIILDQFDFSEKFARGAVGEAVANQYCYRVSQTLAGHGLIEFASKAIKREPFNWEHWGLGQELIYAVFGFDWLPTKTAERIQKIRKLRENLLPEAGKEGGNEEDIIPAPLSTRELAREYFTRFFDQRLTADMRSEASKSLIELGSGAIPILIDSLCSRSFAEEYFAAQFLVCIGDTREEVVEAIERALDRPETRGENIQKALVEMGNRATSFLTAILDGSKRGVVDKSQKESRLHAAIRAADALGDIGGPSAVKSLCEVLMEPWQIAVPAANALYKIGRKRGAVTPLIRALSHSDSEVQSASLRALGKLGNAQTIKHMCKFLGSRNEILRHTAASAVKNIRPPTQEIAPELEQAFYQADKNTRRVIMQSLRVIYPALEDVSPDMLPAIFAIRPEWKRNLPSKDEVGRLIEAISYLPPVGGKILRLGEDADNIRHFQPTLTAEEQADEITAMVAHGDLGEGYIHQLSVQGRFDGRANDFRYAPLALIIGSPYDYDWENPYYEVPWCKQPFVHDRTYRSVDMELNPLWKSQRGHTAFLARKAEVRLPEAESIEKELASLAGDERDAMEVELLLGYDRFEERFAHEKKEGLRLRLETKAYQRLALAFYAHLNVPPDTMPEKLNAKLAKHWEKFVIKMRRLLKKYDLVGVDSVRWFYYEPYRPDGWSGLRHEAHYEPIKEQLNRIQAMRDNKPKKSSKLRNEVLQLLASSVRAIDRDLGLLPEDTSGGPGEPQGPVGHSGGYIQDLLRKAEKALEAKKPEKALPPAEEALKWLRRHDQLPGQGEAAVERFFAELDELETDTESISDFNEKELERAEQICREARAALAAPPPDDSARGMIDLAGDVGQQIPTQPGKRCNLLLTSEFYDGRKQLKVHQARHRGTFDLDSVSGRTDEQYIDNILRKAEGKKDRTIALVREDLPTEQLERLTSNGIRFVRVNVTTLCEKRMNDDAYWKKFQLNTYAMLLLARHITKDMGENSHAHRLLSFYIMSHFELEDDISVRNFIQALTGNDIITLIRGCLSYRRVAPYDAREDYDNIALALISV